jgi:crotonobetainyl-CoA:carnitine CoA-transferase CaiB-like acyl-CoA transferase
MQTALRELLAATGLPDPGDRLRIYGSEPVLRTPYRVAGAGAAAEAAIGIAIADLWKMQTGREQSIAVDRVRAGLALRATSYFWLDGKALKDLEPSDPWFWFAPVKNGRWIRLHTQYPHHLEVARKLLGGVTSFEDAQRETAKWDGLELEEALHASNGCGGFVRTPEEWAQHPQSLAIAGMPVLEIRRIGDAPPELLPSKDRPLAGIRALDLTRVLAGPTCAKILAEHGADVLKINGAHLPNQGYGELETGIGKLSAFVDLRTEAGVATLKDLVRQADVFSQGYRPGTLAKRGFSPEELAQLRPGIVYTELSAWGAAGPWQYRKGYDTVVQACSGMAYVQGNGKDPDQLPVAAVDYVTGYMMALGTIVALSRRAREGGSWHVRTSLARVAQFIRERGLFERSEIEHLPKAPPPELWEPWLEEQISPAGKVKYIKPVLELSETSPYWARPPVPLGHSAAEWPPRGAAANAAR